MTQPTIDFTAPHSGTDTSRAAAESMKPHTKRLRALVYCEIRRVPSSCDELEQQLGLSHQCCSARVNDLMKLGLIRDSGLRRKTRSGRAAIVWSEATPF